MLIFALHGFLPPDIQIAFRKKRLRISGKIDNFIKPSRKISRKEAGRGVSERALIEKEVVFGRAGISFLKYACTACFLPYRASTGLILLLL
ncbi:hypothetical protein D3Z53_06580 [Lachnospiraceae bacterium]|nr:hypothetical protein [Lachnospiraceae bacterium]